METDSLSCEHCGEKFQRREHRDRHVMRHTGHKPFQCNVCSKSFSRSDTLARHRVLHEGSPRSQPRRRRGQACVSCSKLKQSCDGGHPCSRCDARDKECIYNSDKPARISRANASQINSASSPLEGQEVDLVDEIVMSGDIQPAVEEWHNPPSISPDASGIPTEGSDTIYASVTDTDSHWDHPPALSVQNPFDADMSNFNAMANSPWMPWNTLMTNFSFPWFMEGLEVPMNFADIPDLVDPPETLMHNAPSLHETGSAPIGHHISTSSEPVSSHTHLSPQNICSSYTRPCQSFPEPQPISLERAGTEVFGHVHRIPQQAVEGLNNFYKTQTECVPLVSLPYDVVHAFVELYFEYFDSQFPFLHPSRLEDPDLPWILLLATAAVGSHYSEIPGAEKYNLILCDLLARAAESVVSDHILNVDMPTVQSLFLLHVLWMFSHSHKDKIVLQHKGGSLATMCLDLLGRADKRRQSSQDDLETEDEWQAWLTNESELRLFTCAQVLECVFNTFLGCLVSNLRDSIKQLPCPERLWKSRDAVEWKACREIASDSHNGQGKPRGPSSLDTFASKAVLLELYVDERNMSRQLRTSQLLHSSFSTYLSTTGDAQAGFPRLDTRQRDTTLLDRAVEEFTLARLDNNLVSNDTIFHVIAILRIIPLETLHSATGWQTNKEQMLKSKMYFRDFFQNHDSKARKVLWHSACIFKLTRSSRRLVCYDVLCLTVAMGYIYCYCEAGASRGQASSSSPRPSIVRLDQLQERAAIEEWIYKGADSVVHLTGVGLLDGDDACVRFLGDLERTLANQISWHGFCRAFASSFAQLRRGETPTKNIKD